MKEIQYKQRGIMREIQFKQRGFVRKILYSRKDRESAEEETGKHGK